MGSSIVLDELIAKIIDGSAIREINGDEWANPELSSHNLGSVLFDAWKKYKESTYALAKVIAFTSEHWNKRLRKAGWADEIDDWEKEIRKAARGKLYTSSNVRYAYKEWEYKDGEWLIHDNFTQPKQPVPLEAEFIPVDILQKWEEDNRLDWDKYTELGEALSQFQKDWDTACESTFDVEDSQDDVIRTYKRKYPELVGLIDGFVKNYYENHKS